MTVEELDVLLEGRRVIVDFWAEWCGPCHSIAPILDKLAQKHDLELVKVNIDESPDLVQKYSVMSIPFIHFYDNGELQGTALGVQPIAALEERFGL